MGTSPIAPARRTSADMVFERLYDDIVSLELLPGSKLSEADVAIQFGVSRQPVRDAFNRLGSRGLLRIQPQRATLVEKFSSSGLEAARFVRLSIEIEMVKVATANWQDANRGVFDAILDAQAKAVEEHDVRSFHTLDEDFHRAISDVAHTPEAFELVLQKKAQLDRLCVLSLKQPHEMLELVNDHRIIHSSLMQGDKKHAEHVMREHLTRIDKTIEKVKRKYADYFED